MNFISIPINNLRYKKIPGFLKSLKINPDLVAVSISHDGLRYVPMDWKNYLSYDHRVVKIILTKMDNLFLFVGHSKDDKTIVYNNNFSEIVLTRAINPGINEIIDSKKESTTINETRTVQTCTILDEILDQINKFGILSLSNEQKKELLKLSKK